MLSEFFTSASASSLDGLAMTAILAMSLAGKTMELWLAAIVGFSIGYLLGPLFYDH